MRACVCNACVCVCVCNACVSRGGNSPTKADRMCRGGGYIFEYRIELKNEKINKMNLGISRKIRVVDSRFRTNGCHFDAKTPV